MAHINSIGELESLWNKVITSNRFPDELYKNMPDSAFINLDARLIQSVCLTQKSLQDIQTQKKDLLGIAEPVIQELAGIMPDEIFIVLCDIQGTTILTANTTMTGCVCPGAMADDGRLILQSLQNHCLPELTIYWNEEQCLGGYFKSVVFPIRDKQHEIQGVLSMGSFSRGISQELRLAVFLGASLIETRFQYWQTMKAYADSVIGVLPDLALLINERGDIQSVNDKLIQRIGINNLNCLISKPFERIVRDRKKEIVNRITLPENAPITLHIADTRIDCTVKNNRFITGSFDNIQQLLLLEETQSHANKSIFPNNCITQDGFDRLIGMTPQMTDIKKLGKKVARSAFTVLISGESGTGKEVLAQAIHQESGRTGPFIPINCGAIPRELLQSELFGYVEGSFTGGQKGGRKGKLASADGGTIFLDEIGEMPMEMQVSLLRFLQDRVVTSIGEDFGKRVDVRVIAATNRNLLHEVNENRFRQDLYYRLNEVNIFMPALRDRKADIPLLITSMLMTICAEHQIPVPRIDEDAIRYLCSYDWPGNCRELQNVLKSALIHIDNDLITPESLAPFFTPGGIFGEPGDSLEDIEKSVILNRLMSCDGNISQAAKSLQINRSTLYRKLKDYNIPLS